MSATRVVMGAATFMHSVVRILLLTAVRLCPTLSVYGNTTLSTYFGMAFQAKQQQKTSYC